MKTMIALLTLALAALPAVAQVKSLQHKEEKRRYLVYTPAGYANQPQKAYPLVFNFHGGGMMDMMNGFLGDRLLVNKLIYRVGSPQRGDIAVFHSPPEASPYEPGQPEGKEFIKFLLQEDNVRPYVEGAVGRWFPVTLASQSLATAFMSSPI